MGISSIGQGIKMSTVRHVLATALVFLAVFYFFYGPPLTTAMSRAATEECNRLTGASYRTYHLEWRSTNFTQFDVPHWECFDTRPGHERVINLGWWVDL